jgi:hypothetical protein
MTKTNYFLIKLVKTDEVIGVCQEELINTFRKTFVEKSENPKIYIQIDKKTYDEYLHKLNKNDDNSRILFKSLACPDDNTYRQRDFDYRMKRRF